MRRTKESVDHYTLSGIALVATQVPETFQVLAQRLIRAGRNSHGAWILRGGSLDSVQFAQQSGDDIRECVGNVVAFERILDDVVKLDPPISRADEAVNSSNDGAQVVLKRMLARLPFEDAEYWTSRCIAE